MSYLSEVECDGCGKIETAPRDGGFPEKWTELNTKPSFRGNQPTEKTKRQHWCPDCMEVAATALMVVQRKGEP